MKNALTLAILLSFINSNCQNKITTYAKFTNVFEFANISDYTSEEKDTLKLSKNVSELPENVILNVKEADVGSFIELLTKFKIIYNNETHIYIKYSISKKGEMKTIEITDLVWEKNIWKENMPPNLIFMPINKILKNVNANILFEFYSKENNDLYPEVNKLKLLVKDENGILDINKLADVIERNKNLLSKYLNK